MGRIKRLFFAFEIASVLTSVPVGVLEIQSDSGLALSLRHGADVLLFPGYALTLALTLGRFHDARFGLVAFTNVVVYFAAAYFVLTIRARFKAKSIVLSK